MDPEIEEEMRRYSEKYDEPLDKAANFTDLYNDEIAMQRRLEGAAWPWDIDRFSKEYVMHIQLEANEALRCTNYKGHKKRREIDMEHFRDEIVDIFLYTLAFSGIAYKNAQDLLDEAQKKLEYNKTRQDWDVNK